MDEKQKAQTTALPINHRPEVHQAGAGSGTPGVISLEQDKEIREGRYPADRFDDQRTKERSAFSLRK